MYITGYIDKYLNQLHQLPNSVSDVDNFINEGYNYLSVYNIKYFVSGKWEKEARKRKYLITHNPSYLTMQQFSSSGNLNININLLDENNLNLLDETNNNIIQEQ